MVSSDAISRMLSPRRRAVWAYTMLPRCPVQKNGGSSLTKATKADGERRVKRQEYPGYFQKGGDAAGIVIGARTPHYRVIVRAEQHDFALTCMSLTRSDGVCAANSRNIVFKPLDGIAQGAPFVLDIGRRAPKRLRNENIPLADDPGKPLDVRLKTMRQGLSSRFMFRSGRYIGGRRDRRLQFSQ